MKQTKTNVLLGVHLISESERGLLAEFATKYRAVPDVNALATFLAATFKIELATDPDIVSGFSSDESHLPGSAIGVCRPHNAREVSAILSVCFLCGVPVTVCAGRSNLIGSATPEGGIMLSMVSMQEPILLIDEVAKLITASVGMILEEMRKVVLAETLRVSTSALWQSPLISAVSIRANMELANASVLTSSPATDNAAWTRFVRLNQHSIPSIYSTVAMS